MLNSAQVQQLAKERERDIIEATHARRALGSPRRRVRERLGWSLVSLGVHLALDPRGQGQGGPWHRVATRGRVQPFRPLPRC